MNKDLFLALVNRALGRRDEFAAVTVPSFWKTAFSPASAPRAQ